MWALLSIFSVLWVGEPISAEPKPYDTSKLSTEMKIAASQPDNPTMKLRPVKLALYDIDVLEGVRVDSNNLIRQIKSVLKAIPNVSVVRRHLQDNAGIQRSRSIKLSDNKALATCGKSTGAQYVIVGRIGVIGGTNYLVIKIIDVETTIQSLVSAKASAEQGVEVLLARLRPELIQKISQLQCHAIQEKRNASSTTPVLLKKAAALLESKTILLDVDKQRSLSLQEKTAVITTLTRRLQSFWGKVIVPDDSVGDWRKSLMATGRYSGLRVDFLLEGRGTRVFPAPIHGLISCRARVELRLIKTSGQTVFFSSEGIGSDIDCMETVATENALEQSVLEAYDALIDRWLAKVSEVEGDQ